MQVTSQNQAPAQDAPCEQNKNNRDRVRELLFDKLAFRHPRGTEPAKGQKFLDGIADEMSHLTASHLGALARMLVVHGAGSSRNFWPDRATFIGFAHVVCPRPLTADPKLLSWFGSVEGPKAIENGTLVETYRYFEQKRIPPVSEQAARLVRERSAENQGRVNRIKERIARGGHVGTDNMQWFGWYNDLHDRLLALVEAERARRGKADMQ